MLGMMLERPLLVSSILTHAAIYHADTEVVSRTIEGPIHRYTYAEAERRAKRLARALLRLGIAPGDRVGTLAWNTYRHFELYYGISGIGAVCHTINPRLFDEQIVYIVNHAQRPAAVRRDELHPAGRAAAAAIARGLPLRPARAGGHDQLPVLATYDELVAAESEEFRLARVRRAERLRRCATPRARPATRKAPSTATARPCCTPLPPRCPTRSRCRPATSSARSCRCSTPAAGARAYTAPMNGAKLVLPGPRLDGASLCELFEAEGVTISLGVPTVGSASRRTCAATGARCSTLRRRAVGRRGGAAVADRGVRAPRHRHGAGLGDDRDEPARHRRGAEGQASAASTPPAGWRSRPRRGGRSSASR